MNGTQKTEVPRVQRSRLVGGALHPRRLPDGVHNLLTRAEHKANWQRFEAVPARPSAFGAL